MTAPDELDLALVHALQVHPRASWADVGRALGVAPTTAAARWRRITGAGDAWIAVQPNTSWPGFTLAIVVVGCAPGRRDKLAASLARDGRVLSIDVPASGDALFLTVMVAGMQDLSRLLLDDLSTAPYVTDVHASVAVRSLAVGGDWRLGALDSDQVLDLDTARLADLPGTPRADPVPEDSWPLVSHLLHDPRASFAELARATHRPAPTVRRHVVQLLTCGMLSLRCEVAHDAFGLPMTVALFGRVPAADLPAAVSALHRVPQLRFALQVTGEQNMVVSLLGRTPDELAALEDGIGARLPWFEVRSSQVLLRSVKRVGWVLDAQGRRTGEYVAPDALRDMLR